MWDCDNGYNASLERHCLVHSSYLYEVTQTVYYQDYRDLPEADMCHHVTYLTYTSEMEPTQIIDTNGYREGQ